LASTGSSRRAFLRAAALAPLAPLSSHSVGATDYASAAEVLAAIDGLQAEVEDRLAALRLARADAAGMVAALLGDHARHRRERGRLRRRLGLTASAARGTPPAGPAAVAALRESQQALVYAHAEGLPALGDARAVDVLAAHMIDLARHLTILDLWREASRE
jgi:hypothetical protein